MLVIWWMAHIPWLQEKLFQMRVGSILFSIAFFLVFIGCSQNKQNANEPTDTFNSGTIHISADESFKPVIDAEVQVYEAQYPDTKLLVTYKPEAECLEDLLVDSVRMIIATRAFSPAEENYIADSLKVGPVAKVIAKDAIAVIVHPSSRDSLFTMSEIRQILTGNFKRNLIPVFDGTKATSTIRFIVDSVLRDGDSLSRKALAAKSSEGVIDYVASHPDAVGFIGVSWVGNKDDDEQISFLKKVKIAQLESTDIDGSYVLPVQANIYLKRYPLVRDLVYILKERHRGLGRAFGSFMSGERGQLIFRRAYLVPSLRNFIVRPVRVTEE